MYKKTASVPYPSWLSAGGHTWVKGLEIKPSRSDLLHTQMYACYEKRSSLLIEKVVLRLRLAFPNVAIMLKKSDILIIYNFFIGHTVICIIYKYTTTTSWIHWKILSFRIFIENRTQFIYWHLSFFVLILEKIFCNICSSVRYLTCGCKLNTLYS